MKHDISFCHRLLVALLSAAGLVGCTVASQEPVEYDAVAVFAPSTPVAVGSWALELTRADVAFGPIYFCASASGSSTLCESAVAEVASIARLDGLSPEVQSIGRVNGFTGNIRSASYGYGITWFDTENAPSGASALSGGHSMHFEGLARRGGTTVPLVFDVDLVPQYQGQMAVPTAPVLADVTSGDVRLEVRFEIARWLEQLDRNDANGVPYLDTLLSSGAAAVITRGSLGHDALLTGIKNIDPPEFVWAAKGR